MRNGADLGEDLGATGVVYDQPRRIVGVSARSCSGGTTRDMANSQTLLSILAKVLQPLLRSVTGARSSCS
ncbi:MAG: hypothetical protein R3D80_12680 [Paracoccaceae bacterium]